MAKAHYEFLVGSGVSSRAGSVVGVAIAKKPQYINLMLHENGVITTLDSDKIDGIPATTFFEAKGYKKSNGSEVPKLVHEVVSKDNTWW